MKKVFLYFVLVFMLPLQLFADVYSYSWADNYRGYSIIEIPGVSPVEYIAVGTVYNNPNTNYHGIHFLHIDASGNILNSRTSTLPNPSGSYNLSYRMVDVDAQSSTEFWATIQVTDMTVGSDDDYILPIKLDIAGNIGTPTISIQAQDISYKSVYPTNALIYNGGLYICGYRANRNVDPHTQTPPPDNYYTPKDGVVYRVDITSACPVVSGSYRWTTQDNGLYDYDMPMKLSIDNSGYYLLVTGAMNTGTNPTDMSGILALKLGIGAQITYISHYGIYIPGGTSWGPNPPPNGLYGIDIYHHPITNDVYILSNYFQYDVVHRWGIACLKPNLSAPTTATFAGLNNTKYPLSWAKQFFPTDATSTQVSFTVVGENVDLNGCPTTPSGKLPSFTNVNPFVSNYTIVGTSTTGITSASRTSEYIHQTAFGTKVGSSGFDYYTGGGAASLDDVRRLHTFAIRTTSNMVLMSPYYNRTNRAVNPKLMILSTAGSEGVCGNQITDCDPGTFISNLANNGVLSPLSEDQQLASFAFSDIFNDFSSPIPCNTGFYKTTGITTTQSGNEVKVYPTPASDVLNIGLPGNFANTDRFSLELVNAEGKLVYKTETAKEGASEVKINLPALASGLYFAKVKFNDISKVEKVIIEQ